MIRKHIYLVLTAGLSVDKSTTPISSANPHVRGDKVKHEMKAKKPGDGNKPSKPEANKHAEKKVHPHHPGSSPAPSAPPIHHPPPPAGDKNKVKKEKNQKGGEPGFVVVKPDEKVQKKIEKAKKK